MSPTNQSSNFQTPRISRHVCAFAASLALAGSAAAVTSIVDTFSDENLATNPDDGNGFQVFSNAGVPSTGTAVESGGQVSVSTSGLTNDNTGIVSSDSLTVTSTDTVIVVWDVASASNLSANGLEFLVQGGTDFRGEGASLTYFNLRLRPNSVANVHIDSNTVASTDGYTVSEALDGFTLTLTADAVGWSFSNTGLTSFADLSGGYGASNFVDVFDGAHIATSVQGTGATGTLLVNQITATVIPEPSTGLLLGFVSAVFLARRRRV